MRKVKWILAVVVLFFLPSMVIADQFISYPGTRAKGMGGAYTAISSEVSSVWYNPAGIVMDPGVEIDSAGEETPKKRIWSILIEYSQGVGLDEEDLYASRDVSEHKGFLGAGTSNGKWGFGLFWYSPYSIDDYFWTSDGKNYKLSEDMHIAGAAIARSFFDNNLKIGGTLEYVFLDNENTKFYGSNIKPSDENGVSGSIGILYDVIHHEQLSWAPSLKVSLGYNHRFGSNTETAGYGTNKTIEASTFEKPASDNIGIAVSFTTFLNNSLTLAYDYSKTHWSDANESFENDYDKNAFGAEWGMSFDEESVITNISFRAGYYTSDATESSEGWADVSGITGGFGMKFIKKWAVELAYEDREYDYPSKGFRSDDDFGVWSVSLVYDF